MALAPILMLVLALLWAQALGLAHGIVHGPQLRGVQGAPSLNADAGRAGPSVLEQLLEGHQSNSDCRVFDQLQHADACPTLAQVALPARAVGQPLTLALESAVLHRSAPFEARGPPVIR